jgi:hypothetical protein
MASEELGPLEAYLQQLRHELRRDPMLARRVVEEARDHLEQIVTEERRRGMSQLEAEHAAVNRFGPPGPLARQFDRFSLPLKVMLAIASLMTLAVAAWLVSVIALVLPRHDPARIPLWTGVAFGFLVYSSLSIAYLVLGARARALRAIVLVLSLAAIALGAYAVIRMVQAPDRHFEGYLLLMGLILAGHGLIAFCNTALSMVIARRLAAR